MRNLLRGHLFGGEYRSQVCHLLDLRLCRNRPPALEVLPQLVRREEVVRLRGEPTVAVQRLYQRMIVAAGDTAILRPRAAVRMAGSERVKTITDRDPTTLELIATVGLLGTILLPPAADLNVADPAGNLSERAEDSTDLRIDCLQRVCNGALVLGQPPT